MEKIKITDAELTKAFEAIVSDIFQDVQDRGQTWGVALESYSNFLERNDDE